MDKHKSMLLNVISNEACDVVKSFILVEEVTLFLFAEQCLAPNEAVVIRCCIQIAEDSVSHMVSYSYYNRPNEVWILEVTDGGNPAGRVALERWVGL